MDEFTIIAAIDTEIEKLQRARALLSGIGAAAPIAKLPLAKKTASAARVVRKRRRLSPEARKRIADAQRKRWAATKAAKSGQARKTTNKA